MRRAAIGAVALLALAVPAALRAAPPADRLFHGTVTRVVDGDTIDVTLSQGRARVRLIGVDAPELHDGPKLHRDAARGHRRTATIQALGRRAAAYTEARLLGKTVGLELDVEHRDRYRRLLAYVWLADGTLFNAELVREGWAHTMTIPPNVRYADLFRRLQRDARSQSRGLWASEPPSRRERRPAWRRRPENRARGSRGAASPPAERSSGASSHRACLVCRAGFAGRGIPLARATTVPRSRPVRPEMYLGTVS